MKIILFLVSTVLIAQDKKIDFDPNQLRDPEPKWPIISSPLNTENLLINNNELDSTQIIIEGFRVQLLATKEASKAEQLQKKLLDNLNQNIYIVYEAPNYKVRIGDFIDRRKAENLRKEMIKEGYTSAWIIRTRIKPKVE